MKRLFTGQAAFALLLSLLINGLVVSGASASPRRVQSGNSNVYISLPSSATQQSQMFLLYDRTGKILPQVACLQGHWCERHADAAD